MSEYTFIYFAYEIVNVDRKHGMHEALVISAVNYTG